MLRGGGCTEDRPCRHYDPCAKCQADKYLTPEDWYVVGFYRLVSMETDGVSGLPRTEAYATLARLNGYPESLLPWIVSSAATLHRLVQKLETVDWQTELGKPLRLVEPEDVADGD